jgi:hypothetical protein
VPSKRIRVIRVGRRDLGCGLQPYPGYRYHLLRKIEIWNFRGLRHSITLTQCFLVVRLAGRRSSVGWCSRSSALCWPTTSRSRKRGCRAPLVAIANGTHAALWALPLILARVSARRAATTVALGVLCLLSVASGPAVGCELRPRVRKNRIRKTDRSIWRESDADMCVTKSENQQLGCLLDGVGIRCERQGSWCDDGV